MQAFALLLSQHEVLSLMLVMLAGLLLGRVAVFGIRLGAAGVLFAGLGLSAWLAPYAALRLAPAVKDLGLVLFVYCVGLSSGPGFFRAFRDRGARWNAAVVGVLLAAAALCLLAGRTLGLDRGYIAGVFCGALTNTPALAAGADRLKGTVLAEHPALGYSASYPFGVLGALLLFRLFARMQRQALKAERELSASSSENELTARDFEVTNAAACGKTLEELRVRELIGVVVSRVHPRDGSATQVPTRSSVLALGDIVVAVGPSQALDRAATFFGTTSPQRFELRAEHVDMRRILVSRSELVGKQIGELDLEGRFNAQVTRLRRADIDLLPSRAVRLELGDRLRVVAPPQRLSELGRFFGDSERALADVDFVALTLGLSAGLLLAQLPLVPGGALKLGIAGGPLVVSLLLGRLGRTSGMLWSLPYETNRVLRQFGLLVFLAGVGISSGSQLRSVLGHSGLELFILGALVTLVTNALALLVLRLAGRANATESLGGCSGVQTQPATLAAAYELAGNSEDVYIAYAVVYPVAMISKIVLAQLLALLA
jgi:putative transport protein